MPIDEYRREIVETVRNNPSVILIAETGAGKTTGAPEFLLKEFPGKKIAVTQPRRIAAMSVAGYVAQGSVSGLGGEVGYQVRGDSRVSNETRLKFMTDGLMLAEMQSDPLLLKYDVVVVDEAHERSLNIDFLLGMLRRAQKQRQEEGLKELKIVVMSATIEKEKFAQYFDGAPVIEVPGRLHKVDVYYEPKLVEDCGGVEAAAAYKVNEIIDRTKDGDILIFMPGEAEIKQTVAELKEYNKDKRFEILPLYGSLPPEDQSKVFRKYSKRKVIVATNIAETSVTIDGVVYVIDSGLIKQLEFNPELGVESLVQEDHSRSGLKQRAGRAGRTKAGECYRLFSEENFKNRLEFQKPELLRSNLGHTLLKLKLAGVSDIDSFDWIDRPDSVAVRAALKSLTLLGAIDETGELTEIGRNMAELPLEPELARMVLEAKKYNCVDQVCTLAALVSGRPIFNRTAGRDYEIDEAKSAVMRVRDDDFADGLLGPEQLKLAQSSDVIGLLRAWRLWQKNGDGWAQRNFMNVKALREVEDSRAVILEQLAARGIDANDDRFDPAAVSQCVLSGMRQNIMIAGNYNNYSRVLNTGTGDVYIHPGSVAFSIKPNVMIGLRVMKTSKTFAGICHGVTANELFKAMPEMLEPSGTPVMTFDEQTGKLMEKCEYKFKGSYRDIGTVVTEVVDVSKLQDWLVKRLLMDGLGLAELRQNRVVVDMYEKLRVRSGGELPKVDMAEWYRNRLGDAKNTDEVRARVGELFLKLEDLCSKDQAMEIVGSRPDKVTMKGREVEVKYEFADPNPSSYYESEKIGKYEAIIEIPEDLLWQLQPEDLPSIGKNGRPTVYYSARVGYELAKRTDLMGLKSVLDEKRLEKAWLMFSKPSEVQISLSGYEDLPDVSTLGCEPIQYALDYKGLPVMAYPAISFSSGYYSSNGDRSPNSYMVVYTRTQQAAQERTKMTVSAREKEIVLLKEQAERAERLGPAEKKIAELQLLVDAAERASWKFMLSISEARDLRSSLSSLKHELKSNSGSINMVVDRADEMLARLNEGKRRCDELMQEMPTFWSQIKIFEQKLVKLNYSNYEQYGFTRSEYDEKEKLINDCKYLTHLYDGSTRVLDIEKTKENLGKLEGFVSRIEHGYSELDQGLMELFARDSKNYAKLLIVKNGVVEARSAYTGEVIDGDVFTSKSGKLNIFGNVVQSLTQKGYVEVQWRLPDGQYVIGSGGTLYQVEVGASGVQNKYKAVGYGPEATYPRQEGVESFNWSTTPTTATAVRETGVTGSGLGAMAEALSGQLGGQKSEPAEANRKPNVVEAPKVEKRNLNTAEIADLQKDMTENILQAEGLLKWPGLAKDTKPAQIEANRKNKEKLAELVAKMKGFEKETLQPLDSERARGIQRSFKADIKRLSGEMFKLRGYSGEAVELAAEVLRTGKYEGGDLVAQFNDSWEKVEQAVKALSDDIGEVEQEKYKVLKNKLMQLIVENKDEITDLQAQDLVLEVLL